MWLEGKRGAREINGLIRLRKIVEFGLGYHVLGEYVADDEDMTLCEKNS